jgi:hypothetical protein
MATTVITWAMRYGNLHFEIYDDVDAALITAKAAADDGLEALTRVEVHEDDGVRLFDRDQAWALLRERCLEAPELIPAQSVASLQLRGPDNGDWSMSREFTDLAEAERERDHLVEIVGEDRVRLTVH